MKILVPVDGSKHAEAALHTAIDQLKAKGGELSILTIIPSYADLDLEISAARRDGLDEDLQRSGERIVQRACDIAASAGVKAACKTETADSSVPDAIISFAEKEKIDLVVIGSRGLSPASRFRMGSVASKVVRHSPCSVYVVKQR